VTSVATTYTTNAQLQMPATSDRNWDVPINANAQILDGMTAIGGLAVTTTETPSATLQVAVSPGNFINSSGGVVNFSGTSQFVVPPSSTVYLWLSDAGVLTSGASFPTSIHLRLAQVVSGPTSLTQVVDERIQCSVAGTSSGLVLKAADSKTETLTLASSSTGTPTSAGVASGSIVDVGATFSQPVLNNNFASLTAQVDALIAALKRHGLMGS
jgi:hypothetical protein